VNIEKQGQKIQGFIRIRSKTQGIALSLGDKITSNSLKKAELRSPATTLPVVPQELEAEGNTEPSRDDEENHKRDW